MTRWQIWTGNVWNSGIICFFRYTPVIAVEKEFGTTKRPSVETEAVKKEMLEGRLLPTSL